MKCPLRGTKESALKYIKENLFDSFRCTAADCQETCCAGWQIVIDEASLKRYKRLKGDFASRLLKSIDWDEGSFLQNAGRCSMLRDDGLCDMCIELGEESLCDTCREYPRHTEEYEGIRELSLSLSCPVAARMILSASSVDLTEYGTDEEEPYAEDFKDFDLMLFTVLTDLRAVFLDITGDDATDIYDKLSLITSVSREAERLWDEGDIAGIGSLLDGPSYPVFTPCSGFDLIKKYFLIFNEMETLSDEFPSLRQETYDTLYEGGPENYERITQDFNSYINGEGLFIKKAAANILTSFIFLWTCGAVYDYYIYARAAMAAFMTFQILEFIKALRIRNGFDPGLDDCVRITCGITREIEHSDDNMNVLIKALDELK